MGLEKLKGNTIKPVDLLDVIFEFESSSEQIQENRKLECSTNL